MLDQQCYTRAHAPIQAPARAHTEICNACFAPVFVHSDFSSDGVFLEFGRARTFPRFGCMKVTVESLELRK